MRVNFLGLDWGEKEVGVALAHLETRLAVALEILPQDSSLWQKIGGLLGEHEIGSVVVGVPQYLEPETTNKARAFSRELERRFPEVRVYAANEIFTSKMAEANFREAGKRGEKDHAEAARILLASWLEQR